MIETRKANVADSNPLLNLIEKINPNEKEYLRYDQESRAHSSRLLKNIEEDHVVLFTDSNEIIGFLEYAVLNNSKLWVYSLYYTEAYRRWVYPTLTPLFFAMKRAYKLPIHFAVDQRNHHMNRIAKFIKAVPVCTYADGRIEYKVEEVL